MNFGTGTLTGRPPSELSQVGSSGYGSSRSQRERAAAALLLAEESKTTLKPGTIRGSTYSSTNANAKTGAITKPINVVKPTKDEDENEIGPKTSTPIHNEANPLSYSLLDESNHTGRHTALSPTKTNNNMMTRNPGNTKSPDNNSSSSVKLATVRPQRMASLNVPASGGSFRPFRMPEAPRILFRSMRSKSGDLKRKLFADSELFGSTNPALTNRNGNLNRVSGQWKFKGASSGTNAAASSVQNPLISTKSTSSHSIAINDGIHETTTKSSGGGGHVFAAPVQTSSSPMSCSTPHQSSSAWNSKFLPTGPPPLLNLPPPPALTEDEDDSEELDGNNNSHCSNEENSGSCTTTSGEYVPLAAPRMQTLTRSNKHVYMNIPFTKKTARHQV